MIVIDSRRVPNDGWVERLGSLCLVLVLLGSDGAWKGGAGTWTAGFWLAFRAISERRTTNTCP